MKKIEALNGFVCWSEVLRVMRKLQRKSEKVKGNFLLFNLNGNLLVEKATNQEEHCRERKKREREES